VSRSKLFACVLCVAGIVGGLWANYGPPIALPDWAVIRWPWENNSPVDRIVCVYESLNQPMAEIGVLGGTTSQAIRKTGKWRQYDQNVLPEENRAILEGVMAKHGVPCVALIRGGKVVASEKLPKSDADLATYIQRNGGY
jgi:hypothetical protein